MKHTSTALAFMAVLSACSGNDEPALQTTEQPELFQEGAACSSAMLSGACKGPWAYHPWVTPCYINQTDPACPNKIPGQCHPSCLHAELGLSASRTESISCVGAGCGSTPGVSPDEKCTQRTNAYLNSVAGNLANVVPSHTVTNLNRFEHGQYTAKCNETLTNAGDGVNDSCLPTFDCLLDGACRLASHGNAPPGECGSDQNLWAASGSGLSMAGLSTEQQQGLYQDSCSTLEDHAVGSARLDLTIARVSTTDQYWSVVPMPSTQAEAARRDLVKQAKLMFELGITPASGNAAALRALYASAPGDELSCGVSAATPVSSGCLSFGTTHLLEGPMGMCQRMLSSHVASSVFNTELNGCLDLIARPELAGTIACAIEYRNVVETLVERLLAKALGSLQKTAATGAIEGLNTSLAAIDRWYAGAAVTFAADQAALSDARGRVLQGFWTQAYAVGAAPPVFAQGAAGSETAKEQIAALFSDRIDVDRQVLAAAFATPAPLDELPLLMVTSDALTELAQQLRAAAPLYDFACRVRASCAIADANEATRLLRLIGAIGNDTDLGDALAFGASGAVRAPWHQAFTALRGRRDALTAAYRKATGRTTATLDELYGTGVPAAAAGLAELVSSSKAMWASYAGHGVLLPRDSTIIKTSLADPKVTDTLQSFLQARNNARTQREDYQRTRGDFARTVLDRINNKQFQDRVNADTALLKTEYENLAVDLDGLMAAQDQAEQVIGKFLETYTERAKNPHWFPDFPISGDPAMISFTAAAAQGSGSPATNVPAVAVVDPLHPENGPWHQDMAKGEMLTFDVSGLWAPTCALRGTTLAGTSPFANTTHTFIGPEGFSVSFENGSFTAKEHQSSDFSTVTKTQTVCGSISANLLTVVNGTTPLGQLSVSASACEAWQTGHTETDTTQNGTRFQYGASFSGGLRIPRTPFPTLPGGSLLLVEVVNEADGPHIKDAHVVRPHSSFVFDHAATVYLVANDKGGCSSIDTSQGLSVTYVHAQSAQSAQTLANTMADILATLKTERNVHVAQGSVTASELSALQANAYDQLRAACNCNLSAYPEEVRGMFDAWLSTELAAVERQVRIATAVRGLDSLTLRLAALQEDLAGAANSSRLLALLTNWQLAHLSHAQLRSYGDLLLELANDNILPILHILYPHALSVLQSASATEINNLLTFDWTLPYDEQLFLLETLADAVKGRIDDARNTSGQSVAPVGVMFPKPTAPGTAVPDVPGIVVAAPSRLDAVWEPCASAPSTFCLRRKPTFTITPEDVYGHPLVGLGCQEAAPVVQAFAVVAVNKESGNLDWNNNPRRADIARNADVKFPTEDGVFSYQMHGPLAPARVRILAAEDTEVANTFRDYVRGGNEFQGVSAFNSFTIDLGDFATNTAFPPGTATAVVVYFDALTRTSSESLDSIGVCAHPLGGGNPPGDGGGGPGDGSGGPGDGGGGPGDGTGGPGDGPGGPGGGDGGFAAGGGNLTGSPTTGTAAPARTTKGGRR